jgi:uncharacterized membrane protein YeaQ/YmgE (transglycosylase-associated protein family)
MPRSTGRSMRNSSGNVHPVRRNLLAFIVDLVLVVVFCAIGRHSHDESVLSGLFRTVWPFACGLVLGWLAGWLRARPAGTGIRPVGIAVWLGTLIGGMVLRVVSGQGTAVTFILVAAAVLALFLLGWRALYRFTRRVAVGSRA